MIGFDIDKVSDLINLPEHYVLVMLLTIGKGTSKAWPKGGQLELGDVLSNNRF